MLNATNVTMEQIQLIANSSSLAEFYVSVNTIIYGGYMFFILLWLLWSVIFVSLEKRRDDVLTSMLYSFAIVSVISLLLRGVQVMVLGVVEGLVSDFQMWVFPLLTAVVATIVFAKQR